MSRKAVFWVALSVTLPWSALNLAAGEESPVRRYSSFLGGSGGDRCRAIARDTEGNVYLAGGTDSPDFPVPDGWDPVELRGGADAVVVKLSPQLDQVLAVRTLGGVGDDIVRSLAVTGDQELIVTGVATEGFPVEGDVIQEETAGQRDVFVAVLEREKLQIEYATLLGGSGEDVVGSAEVSADGLVSIVGHTTSRDFPLARPFQSTWGGGLSDSFIVQIRPDGDLPAAEQLVYSTLLGGAGADDQYEILRHIRASQDGRITVIFNTESTNLPIAGNSFQRSFRGGTDAYLAILDPRLEGRSQLVYGSYLGGSGIEEPRWLKWTSPSTLLLVGETSSSDFPVTDPHPFGGWNDVFVTVLDVDRSELTYSTTFGGQWWDLPQDVLLTETGDVVVAGNTASGNFPLVNEIGDFQPNEYTHALVFAFRPGDRDRPGELRFASSLGGGGTFDFIESANAIVEASPGVYVIAGATGSPALPATADAVQPEYGSGAEDMFVTRLDLRFPVPSFTAEPAVGPAPLAVSFDAGASTTPPGTQVAQHRWDFGDESTGVGATISHTYEDIGRRVVTLAVENDLGIAASSSGEVTAHLGTVEVAPWRSLDIGEPRFPGGSRPAIDGATDDFLICAGGISISTQSPQFHFLHQEAAGDFELVAHIEALAAEEPPIGTAAGLMVRAGLEAEPNVRYFSLSLARTSGGYELRSRWRAERGDTTDHGDAVGISGWLKIERRGDLFTSWTSTDGAAWTPLDMAVAVSGLPGTLLAGAFSVTPDRRPSPSSFTPVCVRVSQLAAAPIASELQFQRGDANADGAVDLSDPIATLSHLFLGGIEIPCADAADVDDSGTLVLTDAVFTLDYLFQGGPAPAEPSASCGRDLTEDELECGAFPGCGPAV